MRRPIGLREATRCLAALALFGVFSATATAQLHLGDITVENEGDRPESNHGYRNNQFRISNRAAVPHRVRLTAPAGRMGRLELRSIFAEVEVPAGSSRDVYLWQPALDMQGNGVQIDIDGKAKSVLGVHFPGQVYRQQQSIRWLLFGRDVNEQLRWQANRGGGGPGEPMPDLRVTRLALEPRRWSPYWLSYSAYDGVVLTNKEIEALPQEAREAAFRYVECGGGLTVLGAWEPPAHWKRPGFSEQAVLQVVFPAKPEFRAPPPAGQTLRYSVGFGECLVMTEPNFHIWNDDQRRALLQSWSRTSAPFALARTRRAAEVNQQFEIVKNVEVPVRGLFLLMIGFVIVIGPVNLLWLSRIRRRLWLLWTVPAISAFTCLCVLGYMLLSEGTTTHTRTEALTILDETTGRATTIGWTGIYAPIPPSGLDFDDQTELTGLWSPSARTTINRTIDWSRGQHLNAAWVPARLPVHFQMRKSEARSERVQIQKANDGTWWLSNGLPAALRFAYVADRQGKVFTARHVPAEGKMSLHPVEAEQAKDNPPEPAPPSRLREVFSRGDWPSAIAEIRRAPESLLLPGCYLAALDESPFLEDGVPGPAERKQSALVYGIMKEPFDAR